MGDRPEQLSEAVASILRSEPDAAITVVLNGAKPGVEVPDGVAVLESSTNIGIPAARQLAADSCSESILCFLDDDAWVLDGMCPASAAQAVMRDPNVAVVGFRIVDQDGRTLRRHVPRVGARHAERPGRVSLFLGGACAIRRAALEDAGGYWGELFYGHEELDLAWRMADRGWAIHYSASVRVGHPHAPISRHDGGWERTGRNRVLVARRNLPRPLSWVHIAAWAVLGLVRAPSGECRRAYVKGLAAGRRAAVRRSPMRWKTVAQLSRAGRPPLV